MFDFRWNYRKTTDRERAYVLLSEVAGKRLTYRFSALMTKKSIKSMMNRGIEPRLDTPPLGADFGGTRAIQLQFRLAQSSVVLRKR